MEIINKCYDELVKSSKKNWKVYHRYDLDFWESKGEDCYAYVIINYMYRNKLIRFRKFSLTLKYQDESASTNEYVLQFEN